MNTRKTLPRIQVINRLNALIESDRTTAANLEKAGRSDLAGKYTFAAGTLELFREQCEAWGTDTNHVFTYYPNTEQSA